MDVFSEWLASIGIDSSSPAITATVLLGLTAVALALLSTAIGNNQQRRRDEQDESSDGSLHSELASLRQQVASLAAEVEELKKKGLEEPESVAAVVAAESEETSPRTTLPPKKVTHPQAVPQSAPEPRASVAGGLAKTRSSFFSRLTSVFSSSNSIDEICEQLEEALIAADIGVATVTDLIEKVKDEHRSGSVDEAALRTTLRDTVATTLRATAAVPFHNIESVSSGPAVVLFVGVNGVGKTTTVGKIAARYAAQNKKVLLAACDTFRAAAGEQLAVWAERANVAIEQGEDGAKPSTVAYRAIHRAVEEGFDVVLVDTAGRLHTRKNLMQELESVSNIVTRELPGAPHETVLVLDGSTGQNALAQAREFHDRVSLTGLVVTKLDGTPKGGIVVAITKELGVPVYCIGVGEGIDALKEFDADEFADALLGAADTDVEATGVIDMQAAIQRSDVAEAGAEKGETEESRPRARRTRRRNG